jgi:hypothetical protein
MIQVLVFSDVVNVMPAYQPVVRVCGTRWKKKLCVNGNMSEQLLEFLIVLIFL